MHSNSNQSGFAIIEAILVVIVLGIIGFTGYFVYHSRQATDKALADTGNSNVPAVKKPAVKTAPADSQKFLEIKEWGVEIPYDSSDTLTYSIEEGSDTKVAQVASADLASKYGGGCDTYGSGSIARLSGNDTYTIDGSVTVAQAYASNPASMAKVGSYYYRFTHDQGACADSESPTDGNAANNFLQSVLPKMQAIQ